MRCFAIEFASENDIWEGPRPSRTPRVRTGCGWVYVTVVRDPETREITNVFVEAGKAGGCAAAQAESCCRLITRAIEADDDVQGVADTLAGIKCHVPWWQGSVEIGSCADAIAHAITMDALAEAEHEAGITADAAGHIA